MKRFGGAKRPFKPKPGPPRGGAAKKPEVKKRNPALKNRLRGLERLLRLGPDKLDPKARAKTEQELQALKEKMQELAKQELEKQYAQRYHHVRFFERVKIERAITKLQRSAKPSADGRTGLTAEQQAQLEQLKADLQYVLHFPKGEKYVSLLKDAEDPAAQERLQAERTRLRKLVLQQLRDQAAITEADEGLGMATAAKVKQVNVKDAAVVGTKRKAAAVDNASDQDVDTDDTDDFFLHSSDDEPEPSKKQPVLSKQNFSAKHNEGTGKQQQRLPNQAQAGKEGSKQQRGAKADGCGAEDQHDGREPAPSALLVDAPQQGQAKGDKVKGHQKAGLAQRGGDLVAGMALSRRQVHDNDDVKVGRSGINGQQSSDGEDGDSSEGEGEEQDHPVLAAVARQQQQQQQQHPGQQRRDREAESSATEEDEGEDEGGEAGTLSEGDAEGAKSEDSDEGVGPSSRGTGGPGDRGGGTGKGGKGGAREDTVASRHGPGRGGAGVGAGRGGGGRGPGRGPAGQSWAGERCSDGEGRGSAGRGGGRGRGRGRGQGGRGSKQQQPVRTRAEGGRKRHKK